jgi:hypothetical protein
LKWEQLVKLGLEMPEVIEDSWYGTPALKVRGKGFVRLRPEGDAVVFLLESLEEQEFLLETQPDIYYITDHYVGWPTVLARLSALRAPEARLRLERAYVAKAPPAVLKRRAASATQSKPSRRRG